MEYNNLIHFCKVENSQTSSHILQEVKEKHEEYNVVEWDLDIYERLIEMYYPELLNIFLEYDFNIEKAYLGRLCVAHKYGGLVLSNKMYPIKSISSFIESLPKLIQCSYAYSPDPEAIFFELWPFDFEDKQKITNQVMICEPQAKIFDYIFEDIIAKQNLKINDKEQVSLKLLGINEQCEIIERRCGEKMLYDAFKKYQYLSNEYKTAILPSFIINPCISPSKADPSDLIVFNGILSRKETALCSREWRPVNQKMIEGENFPDSFMIDSQPSETLEKAIKTKVAMIAWQFPNRANTFVMNEVMEMHKRGVDLTIYSMSMPTRECETIYKEELNEIRHKIICVPKHKLIDYRRIREDRIAFFQNDFRENLNLCRTIDPTSENINQQEQECVQNSYGFLERFIDDIKSRGIEKIYAPFANGDAEIAMMLSHHTGIPYYFTAHAYDLFSSYYYERMKAKTVSHAFAISEYNKKYMIENLGLSSDQITVRRINFLAPSEKEVKAKDIGADYIFSAGRFDEMKGFKYSISAFAEFNKKYPDTHYVIVGCGDLEKQIIELVKSLKLEEVVHLVGHVKNYEVLEFIKGAKFSILSSVEMPNKDKEGLPTCFVESMSLGTPCIGTNYSGTPELIDHGINGMLTKEKDVSDIADKMTALYEMLKKDDSQTISWSCKHKVEVMFDNNKNITKLLDHLR